MMKQTRECAKILARAAAVAAGFGRVKVEADHVIFAMLENNDSNAYHILQRICDSIETVTSNIKKFYSEGGSSILVGSIPYANEAKIALDACYRMSKDDRDLTINSAHYLLELYRSASVEFTERCRTYGFDLSEVDKNLDLLSHNEV